MTKCLWVHQPFIHKVVQILIVVREVEYEKETLSWDKWMLYSADSSPW